MAVGDKKPVVMEADRAVPGGIATLGTDGKLSSEQIPDMEALGAIEYINSLPFTRKNLLDNWYFADPIDQRGRYLVLPGTPYYSLSDGSQAGTTTTYYKLDSWAGAVGASNGWVTIDGVRYLVPAEAHCVRGYVGTGYGVDRWYQNLTATTLITDSGLIMSSTSGESHFFQHIEDDVSGKMVTFSALFEDGTLLTGTGITPTSIGIVNIAVGNKNRLYLERSAQYALTAVCAIAENANSKCIAAKLELGSTQTLAHRDADGNWVLNDPPPDKATELAKCQRYYIKLGGSLGLIAPGVNRGGLKAAIFEIPVPVTMRTTPVITDVETYGECLVNGTWYPVTDMKVDTAHAGSVRVFWGDNGISDLSPCVIDGAKFSFSADL